jgi:hypothetical protein
MKVYGIHETFSYRSDKIVAVTCSRKKAAEWLSCLNLRGSAKGDNWKPVEEALKIKNVTEYEFYDRIGNTYYVEEIEVI